MLFNSKYLQIFLRISFFFSSVMASLSWGGTQFLMVREYITRCGVPESISACSINDRSPSIYLYSSLPQRTIEETLSILFIVRNLLRNFETLLSMVLT